MASEMQEDIRMCLGRDRATGRPDPATGSSSVPDGFDRSKAAKFGPETGTGAAGCASESRESS